MPVNPEDPFPWSCRICGSSEYIQVAKVEVKTEWVTIWIDCKNGHGPRLLGRRIVSKEVWQSIKNDVDWG